MHKLVCESDRDAINIYRAEILQFRGHGIHPCGPRLWWIATGGRRPARLVLRAAALEPARLSLGCSPDRVRVEKLISLGRSPAATWRALKRSLSYGSSTSPAVLHW